MRQINSLELDRAGGREKLTRNVRRGLGKRYNVLRNRIDNWDYDLDQLLLGTILFTLLAFLYPTVLTYYALFATVRNPLSPPATTLTDHWLLT